MNIRQMILGGLGALTLASASPQIAKADEPYGTEKYTPFEDFTPLTVDNFDKEVKEADGVVVVVWYSSCGNEGYEVSMNKLDQAMIELKRNYGGDVKFTAFDVCEAPFRRGEGEAWEEKYGPGSGSLATHLYEDGNPRWSYEGVNNDIDKIIAKVSDKLDIVLKD
ncbi:MAG: hypothetical protein ABIJ18_05695 [archaeon]